jgi:hypothetical protein
MAGTGGTVAGNAGGAMTWGSGVRMPDGPAPSRSVPVPRWLVARVLPEAVVGALLVVALALPWTGSGPGAGLSGYSGIDLVGSGAVGSWVPAWVALPLALLPACGALLLALSLVPAPAARRWAAATFTVAAVLGLALAVGTWWSPVLNAGPGLWLVVATVAVGVAVHGRTATGARSAGSAAHPGE